MDKHIFDTTLQKAYMKLMYLPLYREIEDEDLFVMGDIHGDLNSLEFGLRLRKKLGCKYLVMLGDYVDRGSQSIACILRIAELIIEDPYFIPLRGNHEDESIFSKYGYSKELNENDINIHTSKSLFSKLPLIVESENIILMHGFIDKDLKGIETIKALPNSSSFKKMNSQSMRENYNEVLQIIWNDPDENIPGYQDNIRGYGTYTIGKDIVDRFFQIYDKKLIIRSHTFIKKGFEFLMNDRVLNLFSADEYYDSVPHFAYIHDGQVEVYKYGAKKKGRGIFGKKKYVPILLKKYK